MAIERMKNSSMDAVKIHPIFINDDIALEDRIEVKSGARGLAGSALVMHIIGVMAEEKASNFEKLCLQSQKIVESMATFGVSLRACAIPGKSEMFHLGDDEMELGLGTMMLK
jgi:dihydroxyacetone kinase